MAEVDLLGLDVAWLAIPLALGAGALAVWLYLPDARSLSRGQGITLLALRAAAVAIMALLLLQPVLRFVHTGREKSTLAVFVDISKSMSVADTGSSPERVRRIINGLRLRGKVDEGPSRESYEDIAARSNDLLKAVEALAAPGEPIADWRAGLRSVLGPAATISKALLELDTARVPASDRPAVETAAFVHEEFARFEREEGETDDETAGRLKWVAQDVGPAAEKLAEQVGWLEKALSLRARRDAVSGEERAHSIAAGSARLELALRALTSERLDTLRNLSKTHELAGFALSGEARRFDLLREGDPVSFEDLQAELEPTGDATDLAGAVTAGANELARASAGGEAPRLAGVVILSDGRQTAPLAAAGSPFDAAAALGARGIPVYAVGIGSTEAPRDAAIVELSVPESVFKGDTIRLACTASLAGIPEESVPVTLSEGDTPLEIKRAKIEDGMARVAFEVEADTAGVRRFRISLPEFEGESTLGNNSREAAVKVVEDKLRVTVVFEYPRWELRFVRNLIWRNDKVELDVVSFVGDLDGKELGLERKELMRSSVVVLDDVAVERFGPEDRKNLVDFVSRRGGSVIMIAGPGHLPSEYARSPLAELLPFREGARPSWRIREPAVAGAAAEPFTLALAPEGAAEPFMNLEGTAADGRDPGAFWSSLPGFFEYVSAGDVAEGTKVLLKVRETGDPILTVRRYGLGKMIFLAMHETWRWRYKVADRDHGRFWGNLLRYAGEQPFCVRDRFVSLDADRTVYPPGRPVSVRARVVDAEGLPLDANDLVCVLERKAAEAGDGEAATRVVRRRPLEASFEGGGVYRAVFGEKDRLPGGDYTIRVESPRLEALYGGGAPAVTLEIGVRPAPSGEFADTSFSEETLAEMARVSFGRYFDISQIGELPEAVGKGWQERTKVTRVELWSSYYAYALVLALLSAEWILRKRLGLV